MVLARRGFLTGAMGAAAAGSVMAQPATPLVLRRGINTWPWFSLTREYPAPRTDYGWPPFQEQRPVPRRQDLHRLKAAGLDFLRIPVDPGPFLAFDGPHRNRLMDMLFDAVGAALEAGFSVIVNIQANGATHYWTPDRLFGNPTAPGFIDYLAFVAAAARRLGYLDQARVALEPVNEPPQQCSSAVWTGLQRTLLETARRAADSLTLVATGACGSLVQGLLELDPVPLRPLAPLLFTFHFYEPYLFSHQGAPWMQEPVYRALNDVPWPASAGSLEKTLAAVRARMTRDSGSSRAAQDDAYRETQRVLAQYFAAQPDRRFVQHALAMVGDWGTRHGVPPQHLLMGEFGAVRSGGQIAAGNDADRARYVRDVRETAESLGFPWAFWNLFDSMGVMDDSSRALDPAIMQALGLSLPPG